MYLLRIECCCLCGQSLHFAVIVVGVNQNPHSDNCNDARNEFLPSALFPFLHPSKQPSYTRSKYYASASASAPDLASSSPHHDRNANWHFEYFSLLNQLQNHTHLYKQKMAPTNADPMDDIAVVPGPRLATAFPLPCQYIELIWIETFFKILQYDHFVVITIFQPPPSPAAPSLNRMHWYTTIPFQVRRTPLSSLLSLQQHHAATARIIALQTF